jgi:hypothetical protein
MPHVVVALRRSARIRAVGAIIAGVPLGSASFQECEPGAKAGPVMVRLRKTAGESLGYEL